MKPTPTLTTTRHILLLDHSIELPPLPEHPLICALDRHHITQYRRYLGMEHTLVYLDLRQGMHADALVALAGTIREKGCLVVHCNREEPGATLERLIALSDDIPCVQPIQDIDQLNAIIETALEQAEATPIHAEFTPTKQQYALLDTLDGLLANSSSCVAYLEAARGRGKSSILGHWIATRSITATVCAPSKIQAERLLTRAQGGAYRFIPPDQLLDWTPDSDSEWLIIDEAASIPAHVLGECTERAQRLILASTSEGYECAGRNFSLRLKKRLPNLFDTVCLLELTEPIRWPHLDALELLLNETFCMFQGDAPQLSDDERKLGMSVRFVKPADLSLHEFSHVFTMLMAAHYQSSPNDVRMLLEENDQQLILGYIADELVAACWLAFESPLSQDLRHSVWQGKRRVPGHLLTQSLGYHLREKDLMGKAYARIVRIVVAPELQQQGLGSEFLTRIISFYRTSGFFAIGTSFGATHDLLRFWRHAGFRLLRFGQKADAASGHVSALMLYPLTHSASIELDCLHHRNMLTLPFQAIKQPQDGFFYVLPVDTLIASDQIMLCRYVQEMLVAYVAQWVNFGLAQPMFAAGMHYGLITFPNAHNAKIKDALFSDTPLKDLAKHWKLQGKKEAEQYLREVCAQARLSV